MSGFYLVKEFMLMRSSLSLGEFSLTRARDCRATEGNGFPWRWRSGSPGPEWSSCVLGQAALSFFCQLEGWKEKFERGCWMEKRALACFTDFTDRGSWRGFSLTSNVVLLKIVEREKWIIYSTFSLVFKMLQFQSTCKYKAHVANTCVHQQVFHKISWLCRFWCQVLQWSESVSFLYEILLRPFGPTPYGLMDIASSWCPDSGLFTPQTSLPCRDGGKELNSWVSWRGYLPPGQCWYRLCGILLLQFFPTEEREMSSHWYQGIKS